MPDRNRVLIVEDKDDDRRSVRNQLGRYRVCAADDVESQDGKFRPAQTYIEARGILEAFASEIRLVLLDLNIPYGEGDHTAEDKHGGKLLELIHEMNRRPDVQIRVVIVSGQEVAKGWSGENLQVRFKNTVIGIAEKEKPNSLIEHFQRLDQNPLRDRLLDLAIDVVDYFDAVCDPDQGIKERLENACSLAVRLIRNEMDHSSGRVDASEALADDLRGLIKQIEGRFRLQTITLRSGEEVERRFVDASAISNGSWGDFLWRGTLVQHLYALANYRNDYVHVKKKPFRSEHSVNDAWTIPPDTLASLERGELLGQVIELLIRDILQWYIPWHEQVYLPWFRAENAGGVSS
jgi:CheY-like chemotaxis protein